MVDFACVFSFMRQGAKRATKNDVDDKLVQAFLRRRFVSGLALVALN